MKPVDYDSVDSLTAALKGQDALVVTITHTALGKQHNLIEAASKAGVKRFLPSEFGSDSFNEKLIKLPGFKAKHEVHEALRKAARETGLTWTSIVNGPFLDWGVAVGFLINAKEKKVELPDGGNHQYSATTLETIAKAIIAVLQHPEETKNRPVYIQDVAISQKQLYDLVKKYAGADGWTENVSSIDAEIQKVLEEVKKDQPDIRVVAFGSLKPAIWGGVEYNSAFQKLDNELLGIKGLSPAELEAVVAKSVPK